MGPREPGGPDWGACSMVGGATWEAPTNDNGATRRRLETSYDWTYVILRRSDHRYAAEISNKTLGSIRKRLRPWPEEEKKEEDTLLVTLAMARGGGG